MKQTKESVVPSAAQSGPRCVVAWRASSIPGTQAELLHEKGGISQNQDQCSISESEGPQPGNMANRRATEMKFDSYEGVVQEH